MSEQLTRDTPCVDCGHPFKNHSMEYGIGGFCMFGRCECKSFAVLAARSGGTPDEDPYILAAKERGAAARYLDRALRAEAEVKRLRGPAVEAQEDEREWTITVGPTGKLARRYYPAEGDEQVVVVPKSRLLAAEARSRPVSPIPVEASEGDADLVGEIASLRAERDEALRKLWEFDFLPLGEKERVRESEATEALREDRTVEFKRTGGVLEVTLGRDGSLEIDYRDVPHYAYVSQDCRHYLSPREVTEIFGPLASLPPVKEEQHEFSGPPNSSLGEEQTK